MAYSLAWWNLLRQGMHHKATSTLVVRHTLLETAPDVGW